MGLFKKVRFHCLHIYPFFQPSGYAKKGGTSNRVLFYQYLQIDEYSTMIIIKKFRDNTTKSDEAISITSE